LLQVGLERKAKRVRGTEKEGEGRMIHRVDVLKDRTWKLNGKVIRWSDKPGYEKGGYRQVWESIKPHWDAMQAVGHPKLATGTSSQELINVNGDSAYVERCKRVQVTLQEIEGVLVTLWPSSQETKAKQLKLAVIETVFNTRSWAAVEGMRLEDLEIRLKTLQVFEQRVKTHPSALTEKETAVALLRDIMNGGAPVSALETKAPLAETTTAPSETKPAIHETPTPPRETKRPRRTKLDHPEFISPRESMILVRTATRLGWSTSDFVSALVERFGIAGPDFIPAEKWEEVMQMIEGGTEPAPEPQIVLQGMPVLPVGGAR
jgi:hypothetical protein